MNEKTLLCVAVIMGILLLAFYAIAVKKDVKVTSPLLSLEVKTPCPCVQA